MNASVYDNSPFVKERVEPDAIAFASHFYAKNHIPAIQERPGNNTIDKDVYKKYKPDYNLYCYE